MTQNNYKKTLSLDGMVLADVYVAFLEPTEWLGHAARVAYKLLWGEKTPIAHVALILEVEGKPLPDGQKQETEFYLADYGVSGLTLHEWDEDHANKLIYSVSLGQLGYFYPIWVLSVLTVLLESNASVKYTDFLRYPFESAEKHALMCTGFAQMVMGQTVTNPTPKQFFEYIIDLPLHNTVY